jgi:succinate dehydrogenase/fumarate reductase flavoprotein subunit
MTHDRRVTECDVLIIGGGLAACMAAMEAAKRGSTVVLVDKGRLGRSGSSPTSGGVPQAAFGHTDPRDNKDVHFTDTLVGGELISHRKIVRAIVDEVTDRVLELEEIGVKFKKLQGGAKFYQEKRLGSSFARSVIPIGGSVKVMEICRKEVLNREVVVQQWVMITKLFVEDGRVVGAFGVNTHTGDFHLYRAKAAVMAAGSATGVQKYVSANFLTTGDGYVAALDAGATLANLEFLEFTLIPAPKGYPISMAGLSPFTSKGGRFFNARGERILERYDPERLENTTRAIIVRAVYKEMLSGAGPVYLDPSFIPDEKWDAEMDFEYVPKLSKAGVDCRNDRFEWVPALHTFLGGLLINEKCETGIAGLYAAGEASTGTHGANRLSGNAIASALVLGSRAGRFATVFALDGHHATIDEREVLGEIERLVSFRGDGGLDPHGIGTEICETAWETIGVARNEHGLKHGRDRFEELRREKAPKTRGADLRGWIKSLECANLALCGELIARSALERKESRGQHNRDDYPQRDDANSLKWILMRRDGERIACSIEPIPGCGSG